MKTEKKGIKLDSFELGLGAIIFLIVFAMMVGLISGLALGSNYTANEYKNFDVNCLYNENYSHNCICDILDYGITAKNEYECKIIDFKKDEDLNDTTDYFCDALEFAVDKSGIAKFDGKVTIIVKKKENK